MVLAETRRGACLLSRLARPPSWTAALQVHWLRRHLTPAIIMKTSTLDSRRLQSSRSLTWLPLLSPCTKTCMLAQTAPAAQPSRRGRTSRLFRSAASTLVGTHTASTRRCLPKAWVVHAAPSSSVKTCCLTTQTSSSPVDVPASPSTARRVWSPAARILPLRCS